MSKQANPTMIGGFVVSAVALVLTGLATFGSGKLLQERIPFVVFFEGSVTGLTEGAPVRFRGVRVGEVTGIRGLVDNNTGDVMIQVTIELESGSLRQVGSEDIGLANLSLKDVVPFLVSARDLRAKLESASFVTGQLYVSLDYYPGKIPPVHVDVPSDFPEIPAVPSDMQRLRATVTEAVRAIRDLPIEEIFEHARSIAAGLEDRVNSEEIDRILAGLDRLVNSPEIFETLDGVSALVNAPELLDTIRAVNDFVGGADLLVQDIDNLLRDVGEAAGPLTDDLGTAMAAAAETLEEIRLTVRELRDATARDSKIRYELGQTMRDVQAAAQSVRVLADTIERRPNSVLFGKDD